MGEGPREPLETLVAGAGSCASFKVVSRVTRPPFARRSRLARTRLLQLLRKLHPNHRRLARELLAPAAGRLQEAEEGLGRPLSIIVL